MPKGKVIPEKRHMAKVMGFITDTNKAMIVEITG